MERLLEFLQSLTKPQRLPVCCAGLTAFLISLFIVLFHDDKLTDMQFSVLVLSAALCAYIIATWLQERAAKRAEEGKPVHFFQYKNTKWYYEDDDISDLNGPYCIKCDLRMAERPDFGATSYECAECGNTLRQPESEGFLEPRVLEVARRDKRRGDSSHFYEVKSDKGKRALKTTRL